MSDSETHGAPCEDCQVCPECERVAYCLSKRSSVVCEHYGYCGDCNLSCCLYCQSAAELSARVAESQPHDLDPEPHIANLAAWREEMEQWRKDSGYDSITNSRRTPS